MKTDLPVRPELRACAVCREIREVLAHPWVCPCIAAARWSQDDAVQKDGTPEGCTVGNQSGA